MKVIDGVKRFMRGNCPHNLRDRDYIEAEGGKPRHQVCVACEEEIPQPWTDHFRRYLSYNKAVKLRKGRVRNNATGSYMTTEPVFALGLRFVIPEHPQAVKRVWITLDDKEAAKTLKEIALQRMHRAQCDEQYNSVIHQILAEIRELNPDIEEQVANSGDDDKA